MRRPTIAVGLDAKDQDAVLEHLTTAEFGTVAIEAVSEITSVVDGGIPVALAIIDAAGDPQRLAEALAAFHESPASVPVLVVAGTADLEALEQAALGPDDEIVIRPIDPDAIRWRAEAMLIRSQVTTGQEDTAVLSRGRVEAEWASRSPIVAIFNPKGGVGKTTIATNLASALQNRRDRNVLLVDADTVTGHVTLSLGMNEGRTMVDAWLDEDEGGPPETLLEVAATHSSGVRVVSLVGNPLSMQRLDPERVGEALLAARWDVDVIIVDLHPSYSDVNQTIFGLADRILVPVTPDLPAIRAAVQLGDVATEMGLHDRLAMVVNRANSGVSVKQMEETVGIPVVAQVRSGGMFFVRAANEGRTVIELFPKEKIAGDFESLADHVLGVSHAEGGREQPATKASLLGGLFGRKEVARA
jgi:pilus assembly protein CpaE